MQNYNELFLKDFQYDLPEDLIAQTPSSVRDGSRLFLRETSGNSSHHFFRELPDLIPEGSLLIVNDSKVFASRLHGTLTTGGRIETFFLQAPQGGELEILARPFRKLRIGDTITFPLGVSGIVSEKTVDPISPTAKLRFNLPDDALMAWIDQVGMMPLPPYIVRRSSDSTTNSLDRSAYQTVYAETVGSVAAPTAGLHFTDNVISRLKDRSISLTGITLHVGAGTFLPVKVEHIDSHKMHQERYLVRSEVIEQIQETRNNGKPVIAVGTTTFRCLESLFLAATAENCQPRDLCNKWRNTSLFIHPNSRADRYKSLFADGLITNFHQPGSTLLMLVCALIGYENCLAHYAAAVENRYRFLSYGDSNFFWF